MTFRFRYQLLWGEVHEASRVRVEPVPTPPVPHDARRHALWRGLLGWAVFFALVTAFVVLLYSKDSSRPGRSTAGRRKVPASSFKPADRPTPLFVAGATLAAAALLAWVGTLVAVRWQQRPGRAMDWHAEVELTDDGVVVRSAGKTWRCPWGVVVAATETANLVILRTLPGIAVILPRRVFAGEDAAALTSFLAARVTPVAVPLAPPPAGGGGAAA